MPKSTKPLPPATISEYIAGFPKETQKTLQIMRTTIKKAVPEAEEAIKYAIPTFILNGNLVSFAGWKNHIALYPAPRNVDAFKKELSAYEGEKSTVKFPLDKPLPVTLITRIVKFRKKSLAAIKPIVKKK